MNTQDCIKSRKSSRKFLQKEIPREIIREVIQEALRAPSYKNSQPWEVAVVTGKKKEDLSRLLNDLLDQNIKPLPDIPEPPPWPDFIQARISETMNKRAQAFGITQNDQNAVKKSKQANFNFYGAPCGLFFYQEASLGLWSILDMGMFIENVILGFCCRNIATVPQAFLIDYSAEVKNFLNIPGNKRMILGMSVGFSDPDDVRAKFLSPRVDLDDVLNWFE